MGRKVIVKVNDASEIWISTPGGALILQLYNGVHYLLMKMISLGIQNPERETESERQRERNIRCFNELFEYFKGFAYHLARHKSNC